VWPFDGSEAMLAAVLEAATSQHADWFKVERRHLGELYLDDPGWR